MTFESYNAIYGRVFNPWDITKYAGGSSGGEGAAIGARLSPAGVGSDIGGSIRIPAGMNKSFRGGGGGNNCIILIF